ncbi:MULTISPECIES: hypothetical protein [Acidithiobacillus]|jgi:hypothetical protein|uniref:hypothetical protein n=1 Tax=Acidithiobacillus TaxID=119977 RepID=UPI000300F53E|nr:MULTISPECIES: hypothetical protein [Acidithiobacillus]MCL5955921.1 hypothetical protein [Gammaproteobacteria bacterium]MCR0968035.1 hypothetical protein [Acidithiobacillus ferrooxidans]MCR1343980.1 hypothetical protein [Acidithiobacillus ferrooxidans]MCR1350187.1 hypothetical protein [Acidithiobacillus ferrooxidans]MCR1352082.1 hypothetical protein [Acidithiobacillus ferrooxidans]
MWHYLTCISALGGQYLVGVAIQQVVDRGALRFAPVLPNAPVHLGFDLTRPSLGLRLFFKGFDLQWLPFFAYPHLPANDEAVPVLSCGNAGQDSLLMILLTTFTGAEMEQKGKMEHNILL